MDDKARTLLLKLKELAIRGIDGEKENAQAMLDKFLKKYNLTEKDLLDIDQREWTIWCEYADYNKIMIQVIAYLYDTDGFMKIYQYWDQESYITIKCECDQYVLIKEFYDYYVAKYEEDWEVFKSMERNFNNAFWSKYKLYPKTSSGTGNDKELDWSAIHNAKGFMEGTILNKDRIDSGIKQIGNGE